MSLKHTDEDILQGFVDRLLVTPVENKKTKLLVKSGSNTSTKALLSERLKVAQSLLKNMPMDGEFVEPVEIEKTATKTINKDKKNTINTEPRQSRLPRPHIHKPEPITLRKPQRVDLKSPTIQLQPQIIKRELVENKQEIKTAVEVETIVKKKVEEQVVEKIVAKKSVKPNPPDWGKGRFQTLIFKVGNIKLAVPLVKLGGIHRLDPQITRLAGQPEWYLGLTQDQIGNVSVIDTALWIMPDKYEQAKAIGLDYEYIVLLDNTRWGLACSVVDNALSVGEEEVNWSGSKRKRPWLAGMLVDHMCALLDVDALVKMLNDLSEQAFE